MAPVEVSTAMPAADVAVEVVGSNHPFDYNLLGHQSSMMCNKGAAESEKAEADGIHKDEGTDSPVESAPKVKSRFAKFFSMFTKGRSQAPVEVVAPDVVAMESPTKPEPVAAKSCLKKQKTDHTLDASEDAEQTEGAVGSTELDGTSGDEKVIATTSEGADSLLMLDSPSEPAAPSEPAPMSHTDSVTEPATVKKSCLMKCFSMCTKRRTTKPMMVHQSTTVLDGSDDEQKVTAPAAESTDTTIVLPDPEGTDSPTEPAPMKESFFRKCFLVCLCCQPVMLCLRRCSTFLFKCPCLTCSRISKMCKRSQELKPASIVPLGDESTTTGDDESALDIEQGTTALDFRTVHLGDDEKPFVIENVPTVSGTPVDVVMRNGHFAAGCRAMAVTVDATGGTVDAATPGVAVATA